MFTSFHMPVKLSKYTTTHPNIKMQQKMLLQFSSSATFKLSNLQNAQQKMGLQQPSATFKMQQKMLLQFSASSLSATFLFLALVMASLFLAIGGTIVAGTYM